MLVNYKNKKMKRICTEYHYAKKEYGENAELIHQRIDELRAAPSVEFLVKHKIGRCHPLKGSRKGEYAMDLKHPF